MAYVQELKRSLAAFGWSEGHNLEVTYRYAGGNPELARSLAKELVALQPDLIVGHTTPVAAGLHQATRTIPVIFISTTDPVAGGFVASLARPGGNMTDSSTTNTAWERNGSKSSKRLRPTRRGFH